MLFCATLSDKDKLSADINDIASVILPCWVNSSKSFQEDRICVKDRMEPQRAEVKTVNKTAFTPQARVSPPKILYQHRSIDLCEWHKSLLV